MLFLLHDALCSSGFWLIVEVIQFFPLSYSLYLQPSVADPEGLHKYNKHPDLCTGPLTIRDFAKKILSGDPVLQTLMCMSNFQRFIDSWAFTGSDHEIFVLHSRNFPLKPRSYVFMDPGKGFGSFKMSILKSPGMRVHSWTRRQQAHGRYWLNLEEKLESEKHLVSP